jgi:hypothetical protein
VKLRVTLIATSLAVAACGGGSGRTNPGAAGAGAAGVGAAGAGMAGAAGGGTAGASAGGSTGVAGTGSAGASGGAGAAAGATGAAGAGNDGGVDALPGTDGARGDGMGPLTTAGCAGKNYQLCIDFESGIDTAVWTGNANSVVTTDAAHGTHAYHAYPGGGFLKTTKMGTIKNVVWGRFYVHMKPGAPGGHGEIVGVYDTSGDWYEIGWQFNGILGDWHGLGGEKPLRSKPYIHDQWYCVELLFDGAKGVMPQWWIDGEEAAYYMPVDAAKGPRVETQFTHLEVGMTSFAGLGLVCNDGCEVSAPNEGYGNNDPPVMTDLYIDDVAFDTQRIGCIE